MEDDLREKEFDEGFQAEIEEVLLRRHALNAGGTQDEDAGGWSAAEATRTAAADAQRMASEAGRKASNGLTGLALVENPRHHRPSLT